MAGRGAAPAQMNNAQFQALLAAVGQNGNNDQANLRLADVPELSEKSDPNDMKHAIIRLVVECCNNANYSAWLTQIINQPGEEDVTLLVYAQQIDHAPTRRRLESMMNRIITKARGTIKG
jgi:hypothetical protein